MCHMCMWCVTCACHVSHVHVRYSQSHVGWHFGKLKAQSSNVSFATFQWKQTFELWALKELSKMSPQVGLAVYDVGDVCDVHVKNVMCVYQVFDVYVQHDVFMSGVGLIHTWHDLSGNMIDSFIYVTWLIRLHMWHDWHRYMYHTTICVTNSYSHTKLQVV